MSDYRIVCTNQVPAANHPRNAKIVTVGTGYDPEKADKRGSFWRDLAAMDRGDRFYTRGKASGLVAWVEKYWWGVCGGWHIRSAPDAVCHFSQP